MEKQFNREDALMKRLLNEAGAEKPSANFKSRIMMKVEARKVEITPYEPLISKSGWIRYCCILQFYRVAGLSYLYADLSFSTTLNFQFPHLVDIPKLDLSRTMQIAFAFLALFFLEIPFLKGFWIRSINRMEI